MAEVSVDTGGPSREFWRMLVEEIARHYCMGDPGRTLFVKNIPALHVCMHGYSLKISTCNLDFVHRRSVTV